MPRAKKEAMSETAPVEMPVTAKPARAKKVAAESSLTIDLLDTAGKVKEQLALPEAVFGAKINKSLIAQAIRIYLVNQRQGNAQAKTRGQVTGSTRKVYRQKGTGRARHGAITAPTYVGGGKPHGPQPKDWRLDLPKKMRQAAVCSALSSQFKNGNVIVVDGFKSIEPKTKVAATIIEKVAKSESKKAPSVLVVTPGKETTVERAIRNIAHVSYDAANALHTYEIMQAHKIIFMREAIQTLEGIYTKEAK